MIGRLRGTLIHKQPPYLLVDVHGVGYELEASLSTFQALPETGTELELHTHLLVREDGHFLYGFASLPERAMFRHLIRVSGVGAKLALLILSGMTVEQFSRCVREGDSRSLTRLPGVGKKIAERLVVEMRDRVGELPSGGGGVSLPRGGGLPSAISPAEEAVSALVALGYKLPEANRMVDRLDTDGLDSEEIIRQALKSAVRG